MHIDTRIIHRNLREHGVIILELFMSIYFPKIMHSIWILGGSGIQDHLPLCGAKARVPQDSAVRVQVQDHR
jgi:hypothetical protein